MITEWFYCIMEKEKLIADLSLYLELYPVQEKKKRKLDLTTGTGTTNSSTHGLVGSFAFDEKSDQMQNEQLIDHILNRCSDEMLDEIIDEYGEDSKIGQMIRKKRIERFSHRQMLRPEEIQERISHTIHLDKMTENPFYEKVCNYIDKQGFKSDADFYNSIGMPRQLFARLRDPNASLSKKTALWVIVGLKLSYEESDALLSRAGYSFRKNDKRDVVISYILRNSSPCDIFTINEILDHFGIESFC